MADPTDKQFRVGTVLSAGFTLAFRNVLVFSGVAMVAMLPSFVLGQYVGSAELSVLQNVLFAYAGFALILLLSHVAMAGVAYGAFDAMAGKTPRFGACLAGMLTMLAPVLGIAFLIGLLLVACTVPAILLAMIADSSLLYPIMFLSLLPIFLVYAVWGLAIPAYVMERRGVAASLIRSADLTRGNRWRIFGIIVILLLANFAMSFVATLVGEILAFVRDWPLAAAIVDWTTPFVTAGVCMALNAAMATAVYRDLRAAKDGTGSEPTASVFD